MEIWSIASIIDFALSGLLILNGKFRLFVLTALIGIIFSILAKSYS
jgi:hypothetical protein